MDKKQLDKLYEARTKVVLARQNIAQLLNICDEAIRSLTEAIFRLEEDD